MQIEENRTQQTYDLTGCGNGYLEINGERIQEPVFLTGSVLETLDGRNRRVLMPEGF